ncbi:MAG: hypothetical protein AB7V22_00555 [Kiritimatiellia bacterium]
MKKSLKIAVGILVVLVLVLGAFLLALGPIAKKTVNAAGPAALGVPVTLQAVDVSLLRGKITLQGLHVGNPEGYRTDSLLDLDSISVKLDRSTLFSDLIVVRSIAISGLVVTYEKGLLNSNLGALIDQLAAGAERKTPAEQAEAEKSARKVVIEELVIADSRMNLSVTGAAALTGGGFLPIPLPKITLADLGQEKGGVTLVEAILYVLKTIAGTAGNAIAGTSNLLGAGAGALGDGAWAVGAGTVDAGKAVVGGTVDAGKAVVDGAGDALKFLNPFDKK